MRIVAIALLTLAVAAAPAASGMYNLNDHDECDNRIYTKGDGQSCLRFIVRGEAPSGAREKTGDYVFLWLGDEAPESDEGSKSALTGDAPLVPVLYADSNGAKGLQRTAPHIFDAHTADDTLLV